MKSKGSIFEQFAKGEDVMPNEGMETVAHMLQELADRMDRMESRQRRKGRDAEPIDEDAPESAAPLTGRRGRRDPLEIQGVLFQMNVPVGRRGDTMPCYIMLPPVRDERELEKLADEVEREFRNAKVYSPKSFDGQSRYQGNGYRNNNYSNSNSNYDRGNYDRDRNWRR